MRVATCLALVVARRRGSRGLLLLLAFLWLCLGSWACRFQVMDEEPPLRPVRYIRVRADGGERVRTFSGAARAGTESELSFRVGGMVQEVNVGVGQEVRPGQVLARIDPTDYQLQVEEAGADVAAAEAAWRNAESEYERVRALYENQNASKSQLDAARAAAESGRAQLRARENRLGLALARLEYTALEAPVQGFIATVPVEVNENVQPGQTVMRLNYGTLPEVEVAVPEVTISLIQQGAPVGVTFDALPGRRFSATVTEVGIASTRAATTFPVTVRLQEPDPGLRSGMAAEVAFRFKNGGERILVPPLAVGEDPQGRFVFLLEPNGDGTGVVRRKPVVVRELTSDGLEVKEGLKNGDLVVTAGVRRLTDGLHVKLLESLPSTPAAPAVSGDKPP